MADQTEWEKPKCRGCGAAIEFVKLRNFKGEIKNHPVEADKKYIIIATGEKAENGQYIYESKRILTSHFSTCPNAAEFRNKKKEEAPIGEDDKPPF